MLEVIIILGSGLMATFSKQQKKLSYLIALLLIVCVGVKYVSSNQVAEYVEFILMLLALILTVVKIYYIHVFTKRNPHKS